jgi:hypothetical protein
VGWILLKLLGQDLLWAVGWKCDVIIYVCWYWIWPRERHAAAMWMPRGSHVSATRPPRQCHTAATTAPCGCHVSVTWQPRQCHVFKTPSHVICHIIATLSLRVMWQVNSWRPLSSQILGFGLGSMGFAPIYDGLRTSWITLIYDENLSTPREGIRDAQYMTFSNFVIDVILWRNFDDPWRKLTVIDHEIFLVILLLAKQYTIIFENMDFFIVESHGTYVLHCRIERVQKTRF